MCKVKRKLRVLPAEYDNKWQTEVQQLWWDRHILRWIFADELNEYFDKKYRELQRDRANNVLRTAYLNSVALSVNNEQLPNEAVSLLVDHEHSIWRFDSTCNWDW